MKMTKKLDDSYRILIPQEIRALCKWNKYDIIELEYDEEENRIILTKPENTSEEDVKPQRLPDLSAKRIMNDNVIVKSAIVDNPIVVPKIRKSKRGRPRLDESRKFKKTDEISWDRPPLKSEVCPYCDREVEPLSTIKINGNYICSSCLLDLKEQLKQDIRNSRI